jgi:predicted nucleotidyltransferase
MGFLMPEQFDLLLGLIVARLRSALSPVMIYLYGSYAYGIPNRDSDVDLLVVVEDSPLDPYERDALAYKALRDIPVPIDVQVYTRREFDERAALKVSFERTVQRKGKLIHAA